MSRLANMLEGMQEELSGPWPEHGGWFGALVQALRGGPVPPSPPPRLPGDGDAEAAVRAYGHLREWLLARAEQEAIPVTLGEVRQLNRFIDQTLADTVARAVARKPAQTAGHDRLARALSEQTFIAMAYMHGPRHVFEAVSELHRQIVGGREVLGRAMLEVMPELVGQGIDTLLTRVLETGEPITMRELVAHLHMEGGGAPEERLFDFVYHPVRAPDGRVEGVMILAADVTEQVRSRRNMEALAQQLRESEERLRRVAEASGAGFWEVDAATGRMSANTRVYQMLGLVPGSPLYLELALACVYSEDRQSLSESIDAAFAGRGDGQLLKVFRTVGLGNVPQRWVEGRGQVLRGEDGRPLALAGALIDITARKQSEAVGESLLQALGESDERYRLATRATKDAIWDWNLQTQAVMWTEGLRELFGYPHAAVDPTASWWIGHIHPEDRERISHSIHAVIEAPAGSDWTDSYRFQRHDGTWASVEDRGSVVRDAAGNAVRMVGAMQDVTERKAVEALQARRSQHNALTARVGLVLSRGASVREMLQECTEALVSELEASLARVWLYQPARQVLELQASAGLSTHLQGPQERVALGQFKVGRIAEQRTPHLTNALLEDPWLGEPEWARREGLTAFAGYPLLVGDRLVGVVALFDRCALPQDTLDVLKQVADGIALGVERLRAENELRSRVDFEQQLIGIVSHDLRNPLNAILLGATVLSQREVLDARATKSVLRIQSSAERATRMVKDLLDFTQARLGGGIRIEPRLADLHELTRGVLEEVEAAHPTRELEVRHEGEGRGDWDADRLAQVVQNLVTNALKYSPEDSRVRVVTRGEADGVTLAVSNAGAPIPPDKLTSIFEPLQRATAEVDRTGRSVGLGLYIVRSIVAAHGGTISVSSTEDAGTTFTVRLPRAPP